MINVFVVSQKSIVFIEPSDRVNDILIGLSYDSNNLYYTIKNEIVKKKQIKYMKTILYYVDNVNDIIVIDETFNDMFSTAYVKITKLPEIFIGKLEDYKTIVYLLYKQLKFSYDEANLFFSKFRRDVFDTILNLHDGCLEKN